MKRPLVGRRLGGKGEGVEVGGVSWVGGNREGPQILDSGCSRPCICTDSHRVYVGVLKSTHFLRGVTWFWHVSSLSPDHHPFCESGLHPSQCKWGEEKGEPHLWTCTW